ncbi:hypothetical protein L1987_53404 [Smallanthus sonchifolius]|uniref:Uncharacterized protein n=1 Tax=Smallanthus sonchifolius TaxID=185202 RepID=A0ACB9EVI3_9ASTR|nr:hypothetical protein L1987_53404 [Smallanthus sonchifolius]
MMSTHYIQKGILYPLPENQDFSITTFLEDLKDSHSATLTHFHPLAARLDTVKQQNPTSFVVFINPDNSPGARFIHSAVNLKVADILTPVDVPLIVQSFFDHNKAIGYDGHGLSLLSVQVTESRMFWKKLVQWIPIRSGEILAIRSVNEDQFIDRPNPPFLKQRIFHFSSDSLLKLKDKVNSECNTTKISTLQSLSALVWRCVTRARRLPLEQETTCRMATENRKRLLPPLPDNYFSNSLHSLRATATAGRLLDCNIGWAAWRLHQAVVNHDDKVIKEFVDSWLKSPFVYTASRFFDASCIDIWGSPRFNIYGNTFGLGKGLAVRSGYANKFDGKVTVYPGREGGGSIDLEICLLPENMEAFESDEEFIGVVVTC